jgi:hypothetical protein
MRVVYFYEETYRNSVYFIAPYKGRKLGDLQISRFLKGLGCTTPYPVIDDDFGMRTLRHPHPTRNSIHVIASSTPWVGCASDISMLSHEAFHVTENILELVRQPHSRKSSEAWAYLLESIVRRILLKLKH